MLVGAWSRLHACNLEAILLTAIGGVKIWVDATFLEANGLDSPAGGLVRQRAGLSRFLLPTYLELKHNKPTDP